MCHYIGQLPVTLQKQKLPAQIILMMVIIAGEKYVHIHSLFLKFFVSHLHAYQQTG